MTQPDQPQQTWRFSVQPGEAEGVFLVIEGPTTPSRWIAMQPAKDEPGVWTVSVSVVPGRTRARYYTIENGVYLNCGDLGLTSEPVETLAVSA